MPWNSGSLGAPEGAGKRLLCHRGRYTLGISSSIRTTRGALPHSPMKSGANSRAPVVGAKSQRPHHGGADGAPIPDRDAGGIGIERQRQGGSAQDHFSRSPRDGCLAPDQRGGTESDRGMKMSAACRRLRRTPCLLMAIRAVPLQEHRASLLFDCRRPPMYAAEAWAGAQTCRSDWARPRFRLGTESGRGCQTAQR